jgi:hypothetical protein
MTTPLVELSAAAIKSLAEAIRGGRISEPYSAISLRDYASGPDSSEMAGELQRLAKSGMESPDIAYVLDAIAAEAREISQSRNWWSGVDGPESIQSATRDTGVVVREMFANAREEVLIAGYAVYQRCIKGSGFLRNWPTGWMRCRGSHMHVPKHHSRLSRSKKRGGAASGVRGIIQAKRLAGAASAGGIL